MKKDFNFILITLIVSIISGFSNKVNSQGFEGTIIYQTSFENANPEKVSEQQFNLMINNFAFSGILYVKQNKYKFVATDESNKSQTIMLYDPESKNNYTYLGNQNKMCFVGKANVQNQQPIIISKDINDTIFVLGKICSSITMSDEANNEVIIYYAEDYTFDVKFLKDDAFGFLAYFYECGAVPLKIITKASNSPINMIYTAKEVSEETLNDKIFKLPKFKEIMEFPIQLKN